MLLQRESTHHWYLLSGSEKSKVKNGVYKRQVLKIKVDQVLATSSGNEMFVCEQCWKRHTTDRPTKPAITPPFRYVSSISTLFLCTRCDRSKTWLSIILIDSLYYFCNADLYLFGETSNGHDKHLTRVSIKYFMV